MLMLIKVRNYLMNETEEAHVRVCELKGKQLWHVRANERCDNGDELVTTKSRTRVQCIRPCKCVITRYRNGKEKCRS